MKINKVCLVLCIVCAILTLISSLSLCLIADLHNIDLVHTFRWCVCLTIMFGGGTFACLVGAFDVF